MCQLLEKVNLPARGAIFLCLLGIALALPAINVDPKKCLKRHGMFPKPGSFCKSYYRCENWVPHEEVCPDDQNFNPLKGWCDWLELFPCFEKPKSKECLLPDGKFLKPGTMCKIFYDCCNGVPTEKKCPGDTVFDPKAGKCEWPELYTCEEGISTRMTEIVTQTTSTVITAVTPDETTSTENIFETSSYPGSSTNSPMTTSTENVIFSTNDNVYTEPEISSKFSSYPTNTFTDQYTRKETSSPSFTDTEFYSRITSPNILTTGFVSVTRNEMTTGDTFFSESTTGDNTNTWEEVKSSVYSISASPLTKNTMEDRITWPPEITNSPGEGFSITTPPDKLDTSVTVTKIPKEKTSDTRDITESTTLNIMCPEPSGYFPHPTDKHKFIGCVGGIPSIFDCPSNLIYNHSKRRCDYP